MKYKSWIFFLLPGLIFLYSCESRLNVEEYVAMIEGNPTEINKIARSGEFNVQAKFLTPEFQYIRNYNLSEIEKSDEILAEYSSHHSFMLRLQHEDYNGNFLVKKSTSEEQYAQLTRYLSFDFKHNISLVKGNDTLECEIYHLEKNYGMKPFVDVQLVFPNNSSSISNLKLIINDDVLGIGKVKMLFTEHDLRNLPKLKI